MLNCLDWIIQRFIHTLAVNHDNNVLFEPVDISLPQPPFIQGVWSKRTPLDLLSSSSSCISQITDIWMKPSSFTGKSASFVLSYVAKASSLHSLILALQVSLPSPSQLLLFNHLRTKAGGWGLMGTSTVNLWCLPFDSVSSSLLFSTVEQ